MIEVIEGLPDNVLGIVVRGRITREDRSEVLLPALEERLEWHQKLRLYYEIRSRYPGAAWEEITPAIGQGPVWERVAIVSDVAWVRHTVQALRLLIPSEIRVFGTSETLDGLTWIVGSAARARRSVPVHAAAAASRGPRSYTPAPQFLYQSP
jgi:hypothetical protein